MSEPGRLVYAVPEVKGDIAAVLSVDKAKDMDPVRVEIALMACGPGVEKQYDG